MSSLVHDLHRDALNSSIALPDLLRKALVVARKLGVGDFEAWARHELAGYPEDVATPPYRVLRGDVKAWNPHLRRWIPVVIQDDAIAEQYATRADRQSAAAVDALVRGASPDSLFHMAFSRQAQEALMADAAGELDLGVIPTLLVQRPSLVAILDGVRTTVLNWALRLEDDGILGEGTSFSSDERRRAAESGAGHVYNITNFHGDVADAQIQQFTTGSAQHGRTSGVDTAGLTAFVQQVRAAVPDLPLAPAAQDEMRAELDTLAAEAASPTPKLAVVRRSLRTLRSLVEGAAGSLIASGILAEAAKLLGP